MYFNVNLFVWNLKIISLVNSLNLYNEIKNLPSQYIYIFLNDVIIKENYKYFLFLFIFYFIQKMYFFINKAQILNKINFMG